MGLGLESTGTAADYSSYTSVWAASSPWASSTTGAGLTEGDFDIGRIPEIGLDFGLGCAFPGPGGEFVSYEGGESGEFDRSGQPPSAELELHFGDMDMDMSMGEMQMGFDEMMAGQGF